jgi:tRNA A37 methylthiotransferase MiaB
MKLSVLDYNNLYRSPDSAPTFEKYSKRKDNFLTKSQELLIQMKKDEAAQRMQRLQQMKEAQDQENKERNMGAAQTTVAHQMIMFETEDHQRVMEMRPHVKNMVSIIRSNIAKLRDSNNKGTDFEFDNE